MKENRPFIIRSKFIIKSAILEKDVVYGVEYSSNRYETEQAAIDALPGYKTRYDDKLVVALTVLEEKCSFEVEQTLKKI